jgi:hypothetical protein
MGITTTIYLEKKKKRKKRMIRLGEEELEKAVIEIREKGAELAEAEAQYQYLESMHKITKATVFLETKGQGLTVRDRESMAESHKDVVKYIPLIKEQKKKYLSLRHHISSIETACNLFRTNSANIRGEKKLYGDLS